VKDADLQTQVTDNKASALLAISSTQSVLTDLLSQETDRAVASEMGIQTSLDSLTEIVGKINEVVFRLTIEFPQLRHISNKHLILKAFTLSPLLI
jgi:hypothetical protein